MESASYVLSFRIVFLYLVITGWIFEISLGEIQSTNQSINNYIYNTVLKNASIEFCQPQPDK